MSRTKSVKLHLSHLVLPENRYTECTKVHKLEENSFFFFFSFSCWE
uniref:Uncharacterized protein n=1 Tax=Anguilla anguilla TaxID=7936 RepID=A0A0E9WUY9_ANGAN